MLGRISIMMMLAVAACGGSDDPPAGVDAPVNNGVDAAAATVVEVSPCAGETLVVESTGGFRFAPKDTTITVGQIIKFEMGSTHDVAPTSAMTDSGLRVGFGATKCLKFTAAGKFNYKCTPHGFTGSVQVN